VTWVMSRITFFSLETVSFGARQVHGFAKRTISSEIVLDAADGTPR
jgi:hypothetical protein